MYRQGTEADWTFLELFKLQSQDSPGLRYVATIWTRMFELSLRRREAFHGAGLLHRASRL